MSDHDTPGSENDCRDCLKWRVIDAEQEVLRMKEILEALRDAKNEEVKQLRTENARLEADNAKMDADNMRLLNRNTELSNTVASKMQLLAEMQSKLNDACTRRDVSELQVRVQELAMEKADITQAYRQALGKQQEEIRELQQTVVAHEEDLKKSRNVSSTLASERDYLRDEVLALRAERDSLLGRIRTNTEDHHKREVKRLTDIIRAREGALDAAQRQVGEWKRGAAEAGADAGWLEGELAKAKRDVKTAEARATKASMRLAQLETSIRVAANSLKDIVSGS